MSKKSTIIVDNSPEFRAEMLDFITNQIYSTLCEMHESLAANLGEESAKDIVVNALGANLGHIIGQFDVKEQRKYSTITKQLIKDHTLLGTMKKAEHLYGHIGHA